MSTTVNDVADLVAAWRSSARLWGHSHCQVVHLDCLSSYEALVILDLLDRIRDGYFDAVLSRVRHHGTEGPPPVRTRALPLGLPALNVEASARVAKANQDIEIASWFAPTDEPPFAADGASGACTRVITGSARAASRENTSSSTSSHHWRRSGKAGSSQRRETRSALERATNWWDIERRARDVILRGAAYRCGAARILSNPVSGPTSIWSLADTRSLTAFPEVKRVAFFLCHFSKTDLCRPLAALTNMTSLDNSSYVGWPILQLWSHTLRYQGPLPKGCPAHSFGPSRPSKGVDGEESFHTSLYPTLGENFLQCVFPRGSAPLREWAMKSAADPETGSLPSLSSCPSSWSTLYERWRDKAPNPSRVEGRPWRWRGCGWGRYAAR